MKNAFHFTSKAIFILEIFMFLSLLFGYLENCLDDKTKVNFKIYGVSDWTRNSYNAYNVQYLKNKGN